MNKIVFLKNINTVYDVNFIKIGTNQVRLIFTESIPNDEVLLSGFNLVNEHNGRIQTKCTDYIYKYRTYEDNKVIELSNDGSVWTQPLMKVSFYASEGCVLDGEEVQEVCNYEDLKVPSVITEEGYEFKGWTPEIPTKGAVEKDTTFHAVIVDKNVYFHCSGGGQLDGEIKQFVEDYRELVIPTPIPDADYKFVNWMPEIPTEGTIECRDFYAVFESNIPDRLSFVEEDLTDTQLGLVENFDFTLATAEEVTDCQMALVELYNMFLTQIAE